MELLFAAVEPLALELLELLQAARPAARAAMLAAPAIALNEGLNIGFTPACIGG
ncbi:MAG TPA: hypothetical protein VGD83_05495 [Streptosporangiaceae bacterium]